MPTLIQGPWPLHWTPNADEFQGSTEGLLRADNLVPEEDGSLSLIRGTKRISNTAITSGGVNHPITQIYSKTMDLYSLNGEGWNLGTAAKVRYLIAKEKILRNWSPTNSLENTFDLGVGIARTQDIGKIAGFGYGFGHVWITYGNQKKKDNGKASIGTSAINGSNLIGVTDIGLPTPFGGPGVSANDPLFQWVSAPVSLPPPAGGAESYAGWEGVEYGAAFSIGPGNAYVEADMSTFTNRTIMMIGGAAGYNYDFSNFFGHPGTENDVFSMDVRIANTADLTEVIVTFLLQDPSVVSGPVADSKDYYQFSFTSLGTKFYEGINTWSPLSCKRSEFTRSGINQKNSSGQTIGWNAVRGVRVTFVNAAYNNQNFIIQNMRFTGSDYANLRGQYTYVQVDAQNNGMFIERSRGGPSSPIVEVHGGTTTVSPIRVGNYANECWIYRIGVGLHRYYLVKKITNSTFGFQPAAFIDNVSDDEALMLNEPLDEFVTNLPDDVIGMECNWKGRNWYITQGALYPSYFDNPSCYDSRWVIETANRNSEINLFITRVSNDTMILATTGDFYEITGTGGILTSDNIDFFDITIRPLGVKSPALAHAFVVREGNLFYHAADGIRVLNGSLCKLLTLPISRLFNNEACHGIPALRILGQQRSRYYLGISKNRLYFSTVQADDSRCLYVYHFDKQIWRYENHTAEEPIGAIWVEDDDVIISAIADYGYDYQNFIRQLDVDHYGLHNVPDGANPSGYDLIPFVFRSVWDCNKQPRNRKDAYTFKLLINTNGNPVKINVLGWTGESTRDNQHKEFYMIQDMTISSPINKEQELVFTVFHGNDLIKYIQLEIMGFSQLLKIFNWSLDYDPRPDQVTNLRVPTTTYGIAGRKRFYEIPFLVDTMKNLCYIAPIVDGTAYPEMAVSSDGKQIAQYLFNNEVTGYGLSLSLRSELGPFEFYELITPRELELLPDPIKYKWVPYTNFNSAARKRFIQYAITIDTRDQDVSMIPFLDGIAQAELIIHTTRKSTVIYTFNYFAIGIEVACKLSVAPGSFYGFEFYEVNLQECVTEKLPPVARYVHIPTTNFGSSSRKRIRQFAFVIDTLGFAVTFTAYVDGISHGFQSYTTTSKTTCIFTFDTFADGIDIGGTLESSQHEFLFYGVALEDCVYEKLPPIASHLVLPSTNFNTSSRKRIRQFAFVVDTKGRPVTFTPQVDGDFYSSVNLVTYRKQTYIYTFDTWLTGVDVGGSIASPTNEDFEFYGLNLEECVYEKLPPIASYMVLPFTNFNTTSRKRMRQYAFVIDTKGSPVVFTPQIDGAQTLPAHTFSTSYKQTYIYTYDAFVAGMEVGGTLHSPTNIDFEFYGLNLEECVYEKLPPIASHMVIPYTNFNTSSRKKFKQFSITIDTRGQNVNYIPLIDGVALPSTIINTNRKETVVYTPEGGAIGVDLGGTLQGVGNADFEFYGLNYEDAVYEKLPAKTQYLEIGPNNYGTAARKRVRTIPFIINTFGNPVTFQPTVDGVQWPANTFTTTDKTTVLYYFLSDNDSGKSNGLTSGIPFGIDYGGVLKGSSDFEFFEMLKPEVVEILPVGKKFDQFGPIEFRRVGKVREVSIRVLHTGSKLDFIIYASDNKIMSGSVTTIPNQERTYSLSLPKGINPNIFRMEISANEVFHRFDCGVRVNIDGAYTENKWVAIK